MRNLWKLSAIAGMAIAGLTVFMTVFMAVLNPAAAQSTTRYGGALLDTSAAVNGTSTYDYVNFGFVTDKVRLCFVGQSQSGQGLGNPVYVHLGNAVTNTVSGYSNSLTEDRMTVPVSSSAVFIGGDTGRRVERAMPFTGASSGSDYQPLCRTFNWNTKGIVVHKPSGIATVDVIGWQEDQVRRSPRNR